MQHALKMCEQIGQRLATAPQGTGAVNTDPDDFRNARRDGLGHANWRVLSVRSFLLVLAHRTASARNSGA